MNNLESLLAMDYPIYKQDNFDNTQVGDVPYLAITMGFIIFIFFIELYLDIRQLSVFYSNVTLPKELTNYVTEETFIKSNSYVKDKFQFKIIESSFSFIETIVFILLGYLPYTWDLSSNIIRYFGVLNNSYSNLFQEIMITWIFILILSLFDTIVNLPFSLYSTFVIEQKHGFNKSTLALFFQDKIMQLGLLFLLGMPIVSLIIWYLNIISLFNIILIYIYI